MKLASVKSGSLSSCRSLSKLLNYQLYFCNGHLMRHHIRAERTRNSRRCPRSIFIDNADLASGMVKLNDRQCSPFMKSIGVLLKSGYVLIFPKAADILMSFARNVCYHKVLGNYHCKAALCLCFMICSKPLSAASVLFAEVHNHCRHDAAVFELSFIYCDWAKQAV